MKIETLRSLCLEKEVKEKGDEGSAGHAGQRGGGRRMYFLGCPGRAPERLLEGEKTHPLSGHCRKLQKSRLLHPQMFTSTPDLVVFFLQELSAMGCVWQV